LNREQLRELHYITAVENVPSMLQLGLLSHDRAKRVPHRSVAMESIQERRLMKRVPGGRHLHEYVNLYINGRNCMMSKVVQQLGE
jgi:ssDNA thymidine ADP-ribosyltransferase DarT-like protein